MHRFALRQVLDVLGHPPVANERPEAEMNALCDDSRRVSPGALFIAVRSELNDGALFARQAVERGAVAVVAEVPPPRDFNTCWIQVADSRLARLRLAQWFFNNPFARLRCHGITGTNGKTTTAFLLDAILRSSGEKVALLGTVVQKIAEHSEPAHLTTPGLLDLYEFAERAVLSGCGHLVMEVSSHALHQGRVAGIAFESALFSNLTQDHLDYHLTMENYFEAKRLLFTRYRNGTAIINVDDPWGRRLVSDVPEALTVRVSRSGNVADVYASALTFTEEGIEMTIPALSDQPYVSGLVGEFNADNLLLAGGWAYAQRIDERAYRAAIQKVRVPGRFEMVWNRDGRKVIVDYAHTPDALERVLRTARALCAGKLHVVFGCGGDRDRGKRPLMGCIAEQWADVCWVTSDNPRSEDPLAIIAEITQGMRSTPKICADRFQAITEACRTLQPGDWLVVAGKGHENYQIIGSEKYPFDDRLVVMEAFA